MPVHSYVTYLVFSFTYLVGFPLSRHNKRTYRRRYSSWQQLVFTDTSHASTHWALLLPTMFRYFNTNVDDRNVIAFRTLCVIILQQMRETDEASLPRFTAPPRMINNNNKMPSFEMWETRSPQVHEVAAAAGIVEGAGKLRSIYRWLLFWWEWMSASLSWEQSCEHRCITAWATSRNASEMQSLS